MSARTGGRRAHRTWLQRLVISFNVIAIVMALTAAGAIGYGRKTVGQIRRSADIGRDVITPVDQLADDAPQNFLIIGVDDDADLPEDDPVRNAREKETRGTVRSDTIMVVRLDPKAGDASILSFPRDLTVSIEGHGRNRINAAIQFAKGDPSLLISTIRDNFGIEINHYVRVDLAGFKDLVDIIDGVPIWFDTPVRDLHSGLLVENPGCTTLDRNGALSYVRSRYFQYKNSKGRWTYDPTSDHGRITRQQDFVRRVLRRAIDQGARNPKKMADLVGVGVDKVEIDRYTKPKDLIALGGAFRSFDPEKLRTYSLPVVDVYHGGASMVDLIETEAEPILALFRGTGAGGTASELSPGSVTVRVLNGTEVHRQASTTTDALAEAGFQVASPGTASAVWRTEVRYRPGEEQAALLVARYLDADPNLLPDPDVSEVTVVTGPDFVEVLTTPKPEGAVTTTSTSTSTTMAGDDGSTTTSTQPGGLPASSEPVGWLPGTPPPGVSCG